MIFNHLYFKYMYLNCLPNFGITAFRSGDRSQSLLEHAGTSDPMRLLYDVRTYHDFAAAERVMCCWRAREGMGENCFLWVVDCSSNWLQVWRIITIYYHHFFHFLRHGQSLRVLSTRPAGRVCSMLYYGEKVS